MEYGLLFVLLVLTMTTCRLNPLDNSMEREEYRDQAMPNDLQKLIDAECGAESPNEIPASHFTDMEYLVLVRENVGYFGDGCMPWYEYALLGGSYDTYEKGIDCYNEANSPYEIWQIDQNFDEYKEIFGEGCVNHYYRRHIAAFSPDGQRVLLKTYTDPPYGDEALYEIYERRLYMYSYIYRDTIYPDRINYTKGLQFATLDDTPSYHFGDIHTFYEIGKLSNRCDTQNAKQYDMTIVTNANDTLFYKADVDSQGNKCIGIYSISDNQLIFRSEPIEYYPDTVDILDNKLIAGFGHSSSNLKYIEINMETNEAKYLFQDNRGSFSPDGNYFARPANTNEYRGYKIYSVATGEETFMKTYEKETAPPNYIGENHVCCWVRRDKVEELRNDLRN